MATDRTAEHGDKVRMIDREYQRKKRANNPGYKAKEFSEYRRKYPEKVKAQRLLNIAVNQGKITRSPCVECGATHRIHGHHPDYSKPYDVIWVCTLHHKKYKHQPLCATIPMSEEIKRELEILWTPKQVATYLNLSPVTVYRWISEKRMLDPTKIVRFSNRVRIPRSEVERVVGIIKKEFKTK